MIAREAIPADRRSYALRLTEKGEQALAHLAVCAAAHDRELDAIAGEEKPALHRPPAPHRGEAGLTSLPSPATTTGSAFLDALVEAGVSYVFANFGSDHPGLVEAIARARATGRPVPAIVTCPTEMVGMSAAHGFALVSGRPQAVFVHVDCGTQGLAGAVHNAARGRVPMLVFAGASPFTQEGELRGSRNEFIQWIQDVPDQPGIVRGYMKYTNEIRTGLNVRQLTRRALQIARSDPEGPVYIMGAREVMEAALPEPAHGPAAQPAGGWAPVPALPLPQEAAAEILAAFAAARRPLVVTSYLGRRPPAVRELVRFAEALGAGVLEIGAGGDEFPRRPSAPPGQPVERPAAERGLGRGRRGAGHRQRRPLIPTVSRPAAGAAIFHIDVDPLKEGMPLFYLGARLSLRADAATALGQLNAVLDALPIDAAVLRERTAHYAAAGARHRARLAARGRPDRRHQPGVPRRLRPAPPRRREHRPERGHHQLRRRPRPPEDDPPRLALRLGRRLARLERRGRRRCQARRPRQHRGGDDGRRVLPLLDPLERPLDGRTLRCALPAGGHEQRRLARAALLDARGASRRLRQPRGGSSTSPSHRRQTTPASPPPPAGRTPPASRGPRTSRPPSPRRSASCARRAAPPSSTWR